MIKPILVLLTAALLILSPGCKSDITGVYQTKDDGMFVPETLWITKEEASIGTTTPEAGHKYKWSIQDETMTLSDGTDTIKLKVEKDKLVGNKETYQKK